MSDLFSPTVARTPEAYAAAGTRNIQSTKDTGKTNSNAGFYQPTSNDNLSLTMQQFLQLMVIQFQNQDMDNPASTSDMMNQLMQMSTIQAMATMTDASTMTYAASLVGKTVTVGEYKNGKLEEIVGTVTGTGTYDGEQVIFIDGKTYKLSQIMAVGEIPEEEPVDPDFGRPHPDDDDKPSEPEAPSDGGDENKGSKMKNFTSW